MKKAWFLADPAMDPSLLPREGWRQVSLPHQWTLDPTLAGQEIEAGWYQLEFPEGAGRRWAVFRADYFADAWLRSAGRENDRSLGWHEGYFEPWTLEIPPDESLLLRVAAPREPVGTVWPRFKRQIKGIFGQHDCRPGGGTPHGQERGSGGLWDGVQYFRTGPVALLGVSWQAVEIDSGWKLLLDMEVDADPVLWSGGDRARPAQLSADLNFSLAPAGFTKETHATRRTIRLTPGRRVYSVVWDLPEMARWEVWERGYPHLYDLRVALDEQTLSTSVGFRTVARDGDWLLLNGRRLFLRGTNVIPTQWLASYTVENAQRDVQLVREAHLNAARVHAHLTHPEFYTACDRQGVLVWQDFPLQWGYTADEAFAEEAVRQARAMVRHFGNHPSIYLWCAHNEPTHNRYNLDPLLAAALRGADPTRLVKEASDFREHPYPGWYWGSSRDFLAAPGAPLPSEFGAQALPGAEFLRQTLGEAAWPPRWETWVYHNFQPDQAFRVAGIEMGGSLEQFVTHSQDYQAGLLKFAIEAFRRTRGRVTGYFQFLFSDPWEAISWSILDVRREPKPGYFAVKEASTPVLLSFVPFRETLEVGQPPISEAWIINDLDRPLELRIAVRLEGPAPVQLFEIRRHAAPQEAVCIFSLGEFYQASTSGEGFGRLAQALRALVPGEYALVGEACEGEVLLSRNEVAVTYLKPTISLGENR